MSTTYRIAEASQRSGFPPSTLRYYEDIGLLPAPARTGAGYRTYDDEALVRLAFISRAKQLGCSLDETTELLAAWAGERCTPVKSRLRQLLADKVASAQQQIVQMTTLTADLQRAAAALDHHTPDGPCDETCGCTSTAGGTIPVPLTARPEGEAGTEAEMGPIACTLDPAAMPGRLADWQEVLGFVTGREAVEGGIRLQLSADTPLGEVTRLAAAEQGCCTFFSFSLTLDSRGPALEVRAPAHAQELVTAVFGTGA
jgi:DNA-binding transcriptional MerR regulator